MIGRKYALAALLAAAVWLAPTAVLAAESSPATPTAPLATGVTEVQFWMAAKPSEAVAIISLSVPQSVRLPATVRLPLVEGMVVDWAGEISGGDASQDIQRAYVTKKGSGGSYVEFVLSEFPTAQVDLSGKAHTQEGDEISAVFELVQSTVSSETVISVRTPALATDVRIDPEPVGEPATSEVGESLYVLPALELKPGDNTTVEVKYSMQLPGVSGSGDAINTLIGVLAAIAVAAIIALVVVSRRSSSRRNEPRE